MSLHVMFDISAECFLQMKPTHTARPTQYPSYRLCSCFICPCIRNIWVLSIVMIILDQYRCPFCKTPNYAVEYRGVKTKEEKSIEQFVSLMPLCVRFFLLLYYSAIVYL